jgi:hypothetical protein
MGLVFKRFSFCVVAGSGASSFLNHHFLSCSHTVGYCCRPYVRIGACQFVSLSVRIAFAKPERSFFVHLLLIGLLGEEMVLIEYQNLGWAAKHLSTLFLELQVREN